MKGPVGERTGNVLNGKHYGLVWIDGYSGPFETGHPGDKYLRAKMPMGTQIITEDEYLKTEAGYEFLKRQRSQYDQYWAEHLERLEKKALADVDAREGRKQAYIVRKKYGLLDIPEKLAIDIKIGLNDTLKITQRMASWRRLLKHVSEHGDWDREFFENGKRLKEEWETFAQNVISRIVDENNNLLPVLSEEEASLTED